MIPRISRTEILARLNTSQPITLVEALPAKYYQEAHLPGAINLPLDQISVLAPKLLPDKRAFIVTYCANGPCPNSGIAAQELRRLGYQDVREYFEGKEDWIESGLPAEKTSTSS